MFIFVDLFNLVSDFSGYLGFLRYAYVHKCMNWCIKSICSFILCTRAYQKIAYVHIFYALVHVERWVSKIFLEFLLRKTK